MTEREDYSAITYYLRRAGEASTGQIARVMLVAGVSPDNGDRKWTYTRLVRLERAGRVVRSATTGPDGAYTWRLA